MLRADTSPHLSDLTYVLQIQSQPIDAVSGVPYATALKIVLERGCWRQACNSLTSAFLGLEHADRTKVSGACWVLTYSRIPTAVQ